MKRTTVLALVLAGLSGGASTGDARGQLTMLGRSEQGRPIVVVRAGNPRGTRVLVVGCIHGVECAGIPIVRALERTHPDGDLWLLPNLNPDGYLHGTRQNGRGVDLNANWSSQWHGGGRPWDTYYPGPRPFSERETRIARNLILRIRPRVTIWYHQHMNLVWAWGPSTRAGRTYARAAGMRFYHHHWLPGTATNWQNHHLPRTASFTVELPAGSLSAAQIRRHVHAVLALATALHDPPRHAWVGRIGRLVRGLPMSVSAVEGSRLYDVHEGDVPRAPASNEKVLLSMALLARFGVRYRVPTEIAGPRPRHGLVAGNVWLVGHGDPELNDARLAVLARRLRARGIRAVQGSVVGVRSTFTRERWALGWRRIALQFVALPTALTYDGNTGSDGFVFDPELRAAASLETDLRRLGVRVTGGARTAGLATAEHTLAEVRSAPLIDIIRRQNSSSLNFDAEVLTKMVGGSAYGPPGSIGKGARAIARWAERHGVAVVAHDGSGLSYADKVSTDGMVRLLTAASREPWGPALRSSLPASGEGTLAGRLLGARVRAKTGTLLQRVSALSGWVWRRRSGHWAQFSILSRGLSKTDAVSLEDQIVAIVSAS